MMTECATKNCRARCMKDEDVCAACYLDAHYGESTVPEPTIFKVCAYSYDSMDYRRVVETFDSYEKAAESCRGLNRNAVAPMFFGIEKETK